MSTFDTSLHHNDAPIWSTAIKWGLISGGIGIVLTMLFYNMGFMEPGNMLNSIISTFVPFAIGTLIVFLGLKNYRNDANNGNLSLGKGIVWSLGYGLIAGVIGGVFAFIFFTFLAPDFITNMLDLQMAEMEEQGLGESEIETATSMMGIFMNPIFMAISGILGQMIYAAIQGLIASLILKTR